MIALKNEWFLITGEEIDRMASYGLWGNTERRRIQDLVRARPADMQKMTMARLMEIDEWHVAVNDKLDEISLLIWAMAGDAR